MIIKSNVTVVNRKVSSSLLKIGAILLIISAVIYLVYLLFANWPKETVVVSDIPFIPLADAEHEENGRLVLGSYSTGAECRSDDFAYEGDYSAKVHNPSHMYGFTTIIEDVQVGQEITAQVWVYSPKQEPGFLAISGLDVEQLYVADKNTEISEDWQLITVSAKVEMPLKENKIKIYCYNATEIPVYFDNLAYNIRSDSTNTVAKVAWTPETVDLAIPDGDYKKLQQKRLEALKQGALVNSDDSWVKGYILPKSQNEENTKVSLRLKGDWTDHLKGDKWSFRVKTPTDKSWNRLKVFSLQTPEARGFLYEWLLHQFFIYEDVLTTRYEFVNVKVNKKDLGLYVYEEHFVKQLAEYNLRKEGPIVKYDESGFWDAMLQREDLGVSDFIWGTTNQKGVADSKPFSENKTFKSPVLAEQYAIAQNLLYEYQYNLKPAADIFDIDLLAKYYAITDITKGYHGIAWHNQRFYYNPVIGKLEPVGYDGFGTNSYNDKAYNKPFLGSNWCYPKGKRAWHEKLFADKGFLEKYIGYLYEFSQPEYIKAFVDSVVVDLYQRVDVVKQDYPNYKFNHKYLHERANKILNDLLPINESIQTRTVSPTEIAVCNRHQAPIKVIGTAIHDNGNIYPLDSSRVLFTTPHNWLPDYSEHFKVAEGTKFMVYQVLGLPDKSYYAPISIWPIPEAFTPAQELKGNLEKKHAAYYYFPEQKRVLFKKKGVLDTILVIPADHEVVFEGGSSLDMIKGAFVLCYSPVQFLGTEEAPILITSSDKSARSFTVIKADAKSHVNYTTFSQLGAFSYKGWNLPGSVNFYESDVDIFNTTITKNSCEDALNIVRSRFLFDRNIISETYGDGFDADFCHGKVTNCLFSNTGNDAIDFSTSEVIINNCKINKAGDKGISIGEQGKSTVLNTEITDAVIGIASKDLSIVRVNGVTLKNCKTGFAAYQKKPEYGHGSIYVESYTAENLGTVHKILPGSYLKLLGREIKGD